MEKYWTFHFECPPSLCVTGPAKKSRGKKKTKIRAISQEEYFLSNGFVLIENGTSSKALKKRSFTLPKKTTHNPIRKKIRKLTRDGKYSEKGFLTAIGTASSFKSVASLRRENVGLELVCKSCKWTTTVSPNFIYKKFVPSAAIAAVCKWFEKIWHCKGCNKRSLEAKTVPWSKSKYLQGVKAEKLASPEMGRAHALRVYCKKCQWNELLTWKELKIKFGKKTTLSKVIKRLRLEYKCKRCGNTPVSFEKNT